MENNDKDNTREKTTKLYTILMTILIIVLLIGFIFMSLILFDILKAVDSFSKDFIEFIRDFFNYSEFINIFEYRGGSIFQF